MSLTKKWRRRLRRWRAGQAPGAVPSPEQSFHSAHYQLHNQRRLEHLGSLGLPLDGKTVLETGAGIGDHTAFYLEHGCTVVATEPRRENLDVLRERYGAHSRVRIALLDLDRPTGFDGETFDIIHCYGTLYHLSRPAEALAFLADRCGEMLLLSTWVSFGDDEAVHLVAEEQRSPTQSIYGTGCRPTRPWVFHQLRQHFAHVYMPVTQPDHPEFPLDWTRPSGEPISRAVFVAAREPIANPLLVDHIPSRQRRP